jgi:uncharacterized SAM-binding protein YcdF (DUF218 family)
MTDLAATRPPVSRRDARRAEAFLGALLGTLLWLECIAFAVPSIVLGRVGYAALPVAAGLGALVGLTRARRLLAGAVVGAALLLAVVAYTPLMRRPARALIRSDPVGARPIQAVVVLSGGITDDGHVRQPVVDRMLSGLSLIRRGIASTLVVSRERAGGAEDAVTSDADQQRIVALLERPVRLLIIDSVFSTRDEAIRTRALARSLEITSIAVVTSPMHTYRACATFEKVGFSVTCVPSESRRVALRALRGVSDRVLAFQGCLYEWAGLAKYRLMRWI